MPRDKKVSHEKIIQAAKDEFSEFSYEKASMRRIGKRCGLTAAALYRHFISKEELFNSLVEPVVDDLRNWIIENSKEAEAQIQSFKEKPSFDQYIDIWKDVERRMISEVIYPKADFFSMMINGGSSGNTSSFLDRYTDYQINSMVVHLARLKDLGFQIADVSMEWANVVIRSYCAALFEPVSKRIPLDKAQEYYRELDAFYRAGWKKMLGIE